MSNDIEKQLKDKLNKEISTLTNLQNKQRKLIREDKDTLDINNQINGQYKKIKAIRSEIENYKVQASSQKVVEPLMAKPSPQATPYIPNLNLEQDNSDDGKNDIKYKAGTTSGTSLTPRPTQTTDASKTAPDNTSVQSYSQGIYQNYQMGKDILNLKPKYDKVRELDSSQTDPKKMGTYNFKQDYVVIIRKKAYYAATQNSEGNYLRVYQVNNFTKVHTTNTVIGSRPSTCTISLQGAERVICAERHEQDDKGWPDWNWLLNGWTNIDDERTSATSDVGYKDWMNTGQKWTVANSDWEGIPDAAGTDFKTLMKAREAKYGWKFAEKCDWEPMDEITILGKTRNEKYRYNDNYKGDDNTHDGSYMFRPIFFGYIDTIQKTYTAGKSAGSVMTIQASDHLKLLMYSWVTLKPTYLLGTATPALDIRYRKDRYGWFDLTDPLNSDVNQSGKDNPAITRYMTSTAESIFAGEYPCEIIYRLASDAGVPEHYLKKRIEPIKVVPYVWKKGNQGLNNAAVMKTRLSVCYDCAQKIFLEFFADEEGNIVLKIPNYVLGANKLPANNMGYVEGTDYPKDLLNLLGKAWDYYYDHPDEEPEMDGTKKATPTTTTPTTTSPVLTQEQKDKLAFYQTKTPEAIAAAQFEILERKEEYQREVDINALTGATLDDAKSLQMLSWMADVRTAAGIADNDPVYGTAPITDDQKLTYYSSAPKPYDWAYYAAGTQIEPIVHMKVDASNKAGTLTDDNKTYWRQFIAKIREVAKIKEGPFDWEKVLGDLPKNPNEPNADPNPNNIPDEITLINGLDDAMKNDILHYPATQQMLVKIKNLLSNNQSDEANNVAKGYILELKYRIWQQQFDVTNAQSPADKNNALFQQEVYAYQINLIRKMIEAPDSVPLSAKRPHMEVQPEEKLEKKETIIDKDKAIIDELNNIINMFKA